ncbi:hypothetical protein [Burkholderia cepacia]|uniref:hypothetical protein n=1 Tax=Burkholderia cepacia TaxID=292 RepID=UPI0012D98CFA|nr:hypothetical protein [Burkholderia cepacia]
MANGDSIPQPGPWQQRHERELVEQRGSEKAAARLHHVLCYWFRRDTWTPDEAFPLLIGIDPDSLSHGDSHIRYLDGALISVAASMYAHGIERPIESFDDFKALENLKAVPVLLHEMKLIWDSGGHAPKNSPGYFIEWARSKGFNVPWLESARDLGLVVTAENNAPVDAAANDTTHSGADVPLARQRFQEIEILRVIRELGHDPAALPKRTPGVRWVKSDVRERFPQLGTSAFDKAWERLRNGGEINETKE